MIKINFVFPMNFLVFINTNIKTPRIKNDIIFDASGVVLTPNDDINIINFAINHEIQSPTFDKANNAGFSIGINFDLFYGL